MKKINFAILIILCTLCMQCQQPSANSSEENKTTALPIHHDVPFTQDYGIKFFNISENKTLHKAYMDRNGVIQVLSENALLKTHNGQFLYPGELILDKTYLPLTDKKIKDITTIDNQFVYLDDEAIFSNAWAGKLFVLHEMKNAVVFAGSPNLEFLVSDGKSIQFFTENKPPWKGGVYQNIIREIKYDHFSTDFWLLGEKAIYKFEPPNKIAQIYTGSNLTAFAVTEEFLIVGSKDGYVEVDKITGKPIRALQTQLPSTNITTIEYIDGNLWFGTTEGAFVLKEDGKTNYYYGERWLPDNKVLHISKGEDDTVLVLTEDGLSKLEFKEITLYDKAMYFEEQVRKRHIRHGFNAGLASMEKGNVDSGRLKDSDNDGLWTAMYLAGQVFRYATTNSEEAFQNCKESLEAMERLFSINPVAGFPSRSFERSGYIERLSDPERWQHANDPEWDWKATTSSDEAIGHMFAYGVIAELVEDENMKQRAITLIDTLMNHIVVNDLYLVDYDGKPTTWGKWHPSYVNARPKMVGDRKLNSSNIISMLQTAYHFTEKEKYKEKAFELIKKHGYLDNLMRPINEIGKAPESADDWSKMLSENWNHSDDEMYFLGYWGLYKYAFNDTLKQMYKEAILDHWAAERPEKEGLWNIMTALTGTEHFDLEEAVWYLQEHPMDLINWDIKNSHRKDLEFVEPNFREQTIKEVLPPDERPIQRHNSNMFRLDREGNNGTSEYSAGDIWLLPYWMGRYLGVISEPVEE